jgi:hypothetical protein
VIVEEEQSANREDDRQEEEVNHEDVGYLMRKICTKEVPALAEEEKC